jgi:hypothetical protein
MGTRCCTLPRGSVVPRPSSSSPVAPPPSPSRPSYCRSPAGSIAASQPVAPCANGQIAISCRRLAILLSLGARSCAVRCYRGSALLQAQNLDACCCWSGAIMPQAWQWQWQWQWQWPFRSAQARLERHPWSGRTEHSALVSLNSAASAIMVTTATTAVRRESRKRETLVVGWDDLLQQVISSFVFQVPVLPLYCCRLWGQ